MELILKRKPSIGQALAQLNNGNKEIKAFYQSKLLLKTNLRSLKCKINQK
jgi:hypothetical protein